MKKSLTEYFREDAEMTKRFINHAFSLNPNISSFSDFSDALFNSFNTVQGKNASRHFNDDETKFLFEQRETQQRINNNRKRQGKGKIEDDEDLEVIRETNKGKDIKATQVLVVQTPKTVEHKAYVRKNKIINPYKSTKPQRFTSAQKNFLAVRKIKLKQKKTTVSKIAYEYNKHFKDNPRTRDSIKSKIYKSK